MYADNLALRAPGQAECFVCLVPGWQACSRRPDVAGGGVPCPPFSAMRVKSGNTAKTGPAEKHPAYCLVMVEFFAYIDARRPRSVGLEEVKGFVQPLKVLGNISPAQYLKIELQRRGYHAKAMLIHHVTFVKNTRERVFMCACSDDGGGGADGVEVVAAIITDAIARIADMLKLRRGGPPFRFSTSST